MNKFTPGPWKCVGTLVYFSNNSGGIDLYRCPDPEANARLIAAAPDLLEALELCRSELAAMKSEIGFRGTTIDVINTADAAIARARGEV
jgi:hypothetical protein